MFWLGIGLGLMIGMVFAVAGIYWLASIDPLPHRKELPPP
jgi:hypothetical protein